MRRELRRRRGGRLMAATAAVGLLVAACGSGDAVLAVGDPAPAFSLPGASGGTVALDDYRGRDVLLYFHMAEG